MVNPIGGDQYTIATTYEQISGKEYAEEVKKGNAPKIIQVRYEENPGLTPQQLQDFYHIKPYQVVPVTDKKLKGLVVERQLYSRKFINGSEYKDYIVKHPGLRITGIKFKPAQNLTADKIAEAYKLIDKSKVTPIIGEEKPGILIEIPNELSVPLPPIEMAKIPPEETLENAQFQMGLKMAGIEGLTPETINKLPGTFMLQFTFEENSNRIKDYFVFWVTEKDGCEAKSFLVNGRFNGKEVFGDSALLSLLPSDQQAAISDYSKGIQTLVQKNGYLSENYTPGARFDEQAVQNTYYYLANNPDLFKPIQEEIFANLQMLQSEYDRLLLEYTSLGKKGDVDSQKLRQDINEKIINILNQLQAFSQQQYNTFITIKDKAKNPALDLLCEILSKTQKEALDLLSARLKINLGEKGSEGSFFESRIIPLEKRINKFFEEYFVDDDTLSGEKKGIKKEEFHRILGDFEQDLRDLSRVERQYKFLPEIVMRCQELREKMKGILSGLTAKSRGFTKEYLASQLSGMGITASDIDNAMNDPNDDQIEARLEKNYNLIRRYQQTVIAGKANAVLAKIEKEDRERLPSEEERFYLLYEDVQNIATGSGLTNDFIIKKCNIQRTEKLYNTAFHISEGILGDNPSRAIIIPLFQRILAKSGEQLEKTLEKFNALQKTVSESELELLGKYFSRKNYFAGKGYNEDLVNAKMREEYGELVSKVSDILKPLDRLCKGEPNDEIKKTLYELVSYFYEIKAQRAQVLGLFPLSFKQANETVQKLAKSLVLNNSSDPTFNREVFDILAKLPETRYEAGLQLRRTYQSEMARTQIFNSQKEAILKGQGPSVSQIVAFNVKAQSITFSPRMLAETARTAAKNVKQVYTGAELQQLNYPDSQGLAKEKVFLVSPETGKLEQGKTAPKVFYVELPDQLPEGSFQGLSETGYKGIELIRSIPDWLAKCGGGAIALTLYGKVPTDTYLRMTKDGVIVDAVGPGMIEGLITVASEGLYEVQGGINSPQFSKITLEKVLNYPKFTLNEIGKILLRRLLEQGQQFKKEEIDALKNIIGRLEQLAYTRNKDIFPVMEESEFGAFLEAVSTIKMSLERHVVHKAGFKPDEVATLRYLQAQMIDNQFVMPGGRFVGEHGLKEIMEKTGQAYDVESEFAKNYLACVGIFDRLHFQIQKMAVQYMPEQSIPNRIISGNIANFWKGYWEGVKEVAAPSRTDSYQLAGLPPVQVLEFRALLYADRYKTLKEKVFFLSHLKEIIKRAGAGKLDEREKEQLRKVFAIKNNKELEAFIGRLKAFGQGLEGLNKLISGTTETPGLETVLKREKVAKNLFWQFGDKKDAIWQKLQDLNYIDRTTNKITEDFTKIKRVDFKLEGMDLKDPEQKKVYDILMQDQVSDLVSIALKEKHALGKRIENLDETIEDGDSDASDLKREKNLVIEEINDNLTKLREVEFIIRKLKTLKDSLADDPIQALMTLESLQDAFNRLDKNTLAALPPAIKKALEEINGQIKEKLESVKREFLSFRENIQREEIFVQEEISFFTSDRFTQEDYENLTKNPELRKLLEDETVLDSAASHIDKILRQQEEKIHGPQGRIHAKSPKEVLDAYFGRRIARSKIEEGQIDKVKSLFIEKSLKEETLVFKQGIEEKDINKLSVPAKVKDVLWQALKERAEDLELFSTSVEFAECFDRTYAKLSVTKMFEKLTPHMQGDWFLPVLLLACSPNNMHGVISGTRDIAAGVGRVFSFDDYSAGGKSLEEQVKILNSPVRRTWNIIKYAAASATNTTSSVLSLPSQFHYLMMYSSPDAQSYQQDKIKDGGLDVSLQYITKDNFRKFKAFLLDALLQAQRQPALLNRLKHLLDKNFLKSALFEKVIKNAKDCLAQKAGVVLISKEEIDVQIDALWPGKDGQNIDLKDAANAPKEYTPLAEVVEDLQKILPEVNRTRAKEDFSRQAISSVDIQTSISENLIDPKKEDVTHERGSEIPHAIKTLENVSYDEANFYDEKDFLIQGKTEEVLRWGAKVGLDAKAWVADVYGPQVLKDLEHFGKNVLGFGDRQEAIDSLVEFSKEFLKGIIKALDYKYVMSPRIMAGFADVHAAFIKAIDLARQEKYQEAKQVLSAAFTGLGKTSGSFSVFTTFQFIFYMNALSCIEQGDYGGAAADAMLTYVIFSVGCETVKRPWEVVKWGGKNLGRGAQNLYRMGEYLVKLGKGELFLRRLCALHPQIAHDGGVKIAKFFSGISSANIIGEGVTDLISGKRYLLDSVGKMHITNMESRSASIANSRLIQQNLWTIGHLFVNPDPKAASFEFKPGVTIANINATNASKKAKKKLREAHEITPSNLQKIRRGVAHGVSSGLKELKDLSGLLARDPEIDVDGNKVRQVLAAARANPDGVTEFTFYREYDEKGMHSEIEALKGALPENIRVLHENKIEIHWQLEAAKNKLEQCRHQLRPMIVKPWEWGERPHLKREIIKLKAEIKTLKIAEKSINKNLSSTIKNTQPNQQIEIREGRLTDLEKEFRASRENSHNSGNPEKRAYPVKNSDLIKWIESREPKAVGLIKCAGEDFSGSPQELGGLVRGLRKKLKETSSNDSSKGSEANEKPAQSIKAIESSPPSPIPENKISSWTEEIDKKIEKLRADLPVEEENSKVIENNIRKLEKERGNLIKEQAAEKSKRNAAPPTNVEASPQPREVASRSEPTNTQSETTQNPNATIITGNEASALLSARNALNNAVRGCGFDPLKVQITGNFTPAELTSLTNNILTKKIDLKAIGSPNAPLSLTKSENGQVTFTNIDTKKSIYGRTTNNTISPMSGAGGINWERLTADQIGVIIDEQAGEMEKELVKNEISPERRQTLTKTLEKLKAQKQNLMGLLKTANGKIALAQGRVAEFAGGHGMMIAFLAISIGIKNRKDLWSVNTAIDAGVGTAGYLAFTLTEKGVRLLLKNGKTVELAGPFAGAVIGASLSAYENRSLWSGDGLDKALAAGALTYEAGKGFLVFSTGAKFAAITPGGPVIKFLSFCGTSAFVGLLFEIVEEESLPSWLQDHRTEEEIKAGFKKLGVDFSVVSDEDKKGFFTDKVCAIKDAEGKETSISRAQFMLLNLQKLKETLKLKTSLNLTFESWGQFTLENVQSLLVNAKKMELERETSPHPEDLERMEIRATFTGNGNRVINDPFKNRELGILREDVCHLVWASKERSVGATFSGPSVLQGINQFYGNLGYARSLYQQTAVQFTTENVIEGNHFAVINANWIAKNRENIGINEILMTHGEVPVGQLEQFPILKSQLAAVLISKGYLEGDLTETEYEDGAKIIESYIRAYIDYTLKNADRRSKEMAFKSLMASIKNPDLQGHMLNEKFLMEFMGLPVKGPEVETKEEPPLLAAADESSEENAFQRTGNIF